MPCAKTDWRVCEPSYARQLRRKEGSNFDLLMGHSPLNDFALRYGLDSWGFFALISSYKYSNSIWDNQNQHLPDQSILLYRGAIFQTISCLFTGSQISPEG